MVVHPLADALLTSGNSAFTLVRLLLSATLTENSPDSAAVCTSAKSLDQIFSVCVSALYAQMKNEGKDGDIPQRRNPMVFGSGQLVIALNNIRFNKPYRKILLNGFVGLGADNFKTDYKNIIKANGSIDESGTYEPENKVNAHFEIGAGLAFRFSP